VDVELLLRADVEVAAVALDLRDVGEVAGQDAAQDGFLLVQGGLDLVDLLGGRFPKFELHLLLLALETIETLYLTDQLVVYLQSLLHGRVAQLVLPADTLPVIDSSVVEAEEEVDEGEEVSFLGSYLLLGFEDAQAVAGKEFRVHFKHTHEHEYLLRAAEFGIKGVHKHAGISHID
jgi:hypothetical protein